VFLTATKRRRTLQGQIVPKISIVSTHCEKSQSNPQKITFFLAAHSSTVIARKPPHRPLPCQWKNGDRRLL